MKVCPANFVLISKDGVDEFKCKGKYQSDGTVLCTVGDRELALDPKDLHPEDPKRLYIVETGKWSRFEIKSIILDSNHIRKVG